MRSSAIPNLFSLWPVEMYVCVPASTSGLTRKAIGARTFLLRRDAVDAVQFRFALDVETENALRRAQTRFLRAIFPRPAKVQRAGIAAGREDAKQFAAGNDVEARAFVAQQTRMARFEFALTA